MNTQKEVLSLLDEILNLNGRSAEFSLNTPLLGAIPELDSMAVVALITSFEDRFGFTVDDDEIEGSTFATLGSLIAFVDAKLAS
nr:acyl carrier protein [Dechloromonas hortensis]